MTQVQGGRVATLPAMNETCAVDICDRLVGEYGRRGWCQAHYLRWKRHGDVRARVPIGDKRGPTKLCTVADCLRKHQAKGYCAAHYYRLRTTGSAQERKPVELHIMDHGPTCTQWHCDADAYLKGLCAKHYQQQYWQHRKLHENDAPPARHFHSWACDRGECDDVWRRHMAQGHRGQLPGRAVLDAE